MKKVLLVLFAVVFVFGAVKVFSATDISLEPLFNNTYNSTIKAIRVGSPSSTATNVSFDLTANSLDTISTNASRKYFYVGLRDASATSSVYVYLAATGGRTITTDAGILLSSDMNSSWEMPTNAVYTGHISAVSNNWGQTPGITVVEY